MLFLHSYKNKLTYTLHRSPTPKYLYSLAKVLLSSLRCYSCIHSKKYKYSWRTHLFIFTPPFHPTSSLKTVSVKSTNPTWYSFEKKLFIVARLRLVLPCVFFLSSHLSHHHNNKVFFYCNCDYCSTYFFSSSSSFLFFLAFH